MFLISHSYVKENTFKINTSSYHLINKGDHVPYHMKWPELIKEKRKDIHILLVL